MKTLQRLMVLSLFLGGAVIMTGCGEAKKAAPAAPATTPDAAPADAPKTEDKADENAEAKAAPANEEATASYTPKMSDDGESQMVSLNLPNMT